MPNPHVPPKPGAISARDEGAIIAWGGIRPFPRGYTFKVYWAAGTFTSPPIPPLTLVYEAGLVATQSSIRSGSGVNVIPINTAIYVAVASVSPTGDESNQSPLLFLSLNNAEQDHPVAVARDDSGQQKTLLVDEDGSTSVSVGSLPLPIGAATEPKQDAQIVQLAAIETATEATEVATESIDSKLNTLGQKTMAGSVPVVLASDQSGIPIIDTVSGYQQNDFSVTTVAANVFATVTPLAGAKLLILQNRHISKDILIGTALSQNHSIPPGGVRSWPATSGVALYAVVAVGSATLNVWQMA